MDAEKSLDKATTKYHCIVSGKQMLTPCDGCENPKGCLSRAMQYKENEEMDDMEEKAIVKISEDGDVMSCAKKLDAKECGYKAGSKVCAACGAMAVTTKVDISKKANMPDDEMDEMNEDAMEETVTAARAKRRRQMGSDSAEMDEDDMGDEMEDEDDEDMEKGWMMKPRRRSRERAMSSLGMKSDSITDIDNAFICQLERKVFDGNQNVCSNCPGGCAAEDGMPGLIDVEGMALEMFGGKVLWSGYVDQDDVFVIDLLAKDGRAVEIIAEGESGEIQNIHRLNPALFDSPFGKKALDPNFQVEFIDIKTAEGIAVKALEEHVGTTGKVLQADSEIFEGHDAYVFEIEANNRKQYDMYVSLDGTVLGYDELDATEVEEIEAEAAEIALKRAYSDERREELASEGMALPDGSYPIVDETDLRNAIQAYGRAKDKEKAKAHIMKRARALGKEDLIPENWMEKADPAILDALAELAELELKTAYSAEELDVLVKEAVAMPDGSMPIKTVDDLRKAIAAYPRAADKEKAKLHIMKRAMDLDQTDMIPMDWVPEKIQKKYRDEEKKKSEVDEFAASLLEFEMLAAEHNLDDQS